MKKFILKVSVFFLVVLVFDILSGKAFSYLADHAKGGDNMRNNYICNETNEDILVFGSSRAIHHYNPIIISDSLGMSCYNCGYDGNGAILSYGRYQLICQRYHPKVLIYDVIPKFDLLAGEDNHKYLGHLYPYYDKKGISEVFESVDDTEKYKMMSQMYRYNSKFHQIAADFVYPLYIVKANGFMPLNGDVDTMRIKKNNKVLPSEKPKFDSLKIAYLNKFIDESNGAKLIFLVSPMWYGITSEQLSPIRDICLQRNIPFLDFSNDLKYVHNNTYFKDGSHLNARGADEFTKDLIVELRKREILE